MCSDNSKKKKNFSCQICNKVFTSQSGLNKYNLIHDKTHQCKVCLKSCHCTQDLNIYMRTHPYVCSTFDKRFAHKQTLQKHQAAHSVKRKFKCKICSDDRYFKTKDHFSRHIKFHYELSNQCEVCLKSFHCKSTLGRHMRIHTGEKPYVCSICDKRFTAKQNLKNHQYGYNTLFY